jgi:signal transduction histidine kinase/CheY-like chemotaxis protein
MEYDFKELVDVVRLQELTDELYAAASIPSSVITVDGDILTGSGWQKLCTDFHRRHPQTNKECIESDIKIRKRLDQGEPFVIYQCPRGLVDASCPIVIAGEHVANVFAGQIFFEAPGERRQERFRREARRFGFDEKAYMDALARIPVFEEKKFRAALSFLAKLALLIGDLGLTRLRELEAAKALRQAQKLEAIGKLAGGIAHDFNNILSPILIQTELAQLALAPNDPVQENLDEVLKSGHRARDLVKQILAFSRHREEKHKSFDMRKIVDDTLNLLRASVPAGIEIKAHMPPEPVLVTGDSGHIRQVLLNLGTNAVQAMEEMGAVLQVRLEDVALNEEAATHVQGLAPGKYVRLTVSDAGHGIPPEDIGKIFDPYFTSKGVGNGAGIGLAVVHGIVQEHGGAVTVSSKPGHGATFHVFLPKAGATALQQAEKSKNCPAGTERVLFVDDEQAIMRSGMQMLERLGYQVDSETSSVKALEAFCRHPNRYDLVMTDMTMPTMSGDVLAKEIMKIRPNIPIILCTGFSHRIDEAKARAMGIRGWLMKPFMMKETAETIRSVLDEQRDKQ